MLKKIDNLGRIVIPIEIRRELNFNLGEEVNMEVEDKKIILSKQSSKCVFCNEEEVFYKFRNKGICKNCYNNIKNLK